VSYRLKTAKFERASSHALLRDSAARRLAALVKTLEPPPSADELRARVGGAWDEIGRLQFEFLRAEGLKPNQTFLDLGCGVLRGGIHFVRYLEPGNYYGIDASPRMIAGGERELETAGLAARGAHLRVTAKFDIDFGIRFERGIAMSVFTHLPLNSVFRALANVANHFVEDCAFYATYFPGPRGAERFVPIRHSPGPGHNPITTVADRNPYHYAIEDFEYVCTQLPLRVENIRDWGHPRGQHMLRFTRT